jgi:hypothetical protein
MSHAEFALFIDPSNEAGKVLMAHFAALQLIMTPITQRDKSEESMNRSGTAAMGTSVRWLSWCHSRIGEGMRKYYEWTFEIVRGVKEGRVPLKFEERDEKISCLEDGDSHIAGSIEASMNE